MTGYLMTARHNVGEEVAETFNMITGFTRVPEMESLLVAPFTLRDQILHRIRAEMDNQAKGKPAAIKAKLNNRYSYHQVKQACEDKGYSFEEEENEEDGTIRLVARKWV